MTLKEQVYNQIFEDISQGKYQPNDILTESGLIKKYQVSKSPIREALVELCKDQVLHSLPRLGYQVVPVTLKEVLDLLEYRIDVESSGLRRGFSRLEDQDVADLEELSSRPPEGAKAPNWDRNLKFHLRLYQINGNRYGYQELQKLLRQGSRCVTQYFHAAWQKVNQYNSNCHRQLVSHLKERNMEEACHFLENDITSIKEEIQTMHSF